MTSIKSKNGIGLIGLLIAVALGSIVSLATMALIQQSAEQQKRLVFKNELVYLKNRFAETLHRNTVFLNTIAASENTNMLCLRNRSACAATHVATAYSPSHDRIVLYDASTAPGQVFYDGRATSTRGYTLKGAACNGFIESGSGNDECPVGYIVNWYVNDSASTEGLALTINAKMVFNPSSNHPLRTYYNSTSSTSALGAYDIAVTKTVQSLTDLNVLQCTVGSVQLSHMSNRLFYRAAAVPTGDRCDSEVRTCIVMNETPNLSGTYTHSTCVQNCFGSWGACSAPCGGGTQIYSHQIPANQWGAACPHPNGHVQSCNTGACPMNCVGSWGSCSGGTQTYTITTPASGGGAACPHANGATQSCGVNCVGSWGSCSGGTRTYTVTTPASGGGAACSVANGTTQSCGTNCVGNWASCSGGSQTYVVTTPASGGGTACSHANGATQSCGVNCVGAWGGYGGCSASCGGGTQTRTYSVTTPATGGGSACPFTNGQTQSQSCNTGACAVNCVGAWGSFGSCSATCGGGTQTQTYAITTPASGGGTACSATHGQVQSQSCNTQACATWVRKPNRYPYHLMPFVSCGAGTTRQRMKVDVGSGPQGCCMGSAPCPDARPVVNQPCTAGHSVEYDFEIPNAWGPTTWTTFVYVCE